MRSAACTIVGLFLVQCAALSAANSPATQPSIPAPAGWKLVWNDEFDGTQIDGKKWDFDQGNGVQPGHRGIAGWGNNELEFYTSRPENAFVQDGMLHLRAIKESYQGAQYTSARMKTWGLFSKKYGRFEIRAKLPLGRGLWPAIWMMPEKGIYGGWPASGEIDIMEARGQEPNKVVGTLHYGARAPGNAHTGMDYILPDNGTIADFHVYALEWEPGEIRYYVDDRLYQRQNFWWSYSNPPGQRGAKPANESELNPWPAPFDHPFYLILNLAVGGNFLGNPDANTPFPAEMLVDYVRVYDKLDGYESPRPRGPGKLPFKEQ